MRLLILLSLASSVFTQGPGQAFTEEQQLAQEQLHIQQLQKPQQQYVLPPGGQYQYQYPYYPYQPDVGILNPRPPLPYQQYQLPYPNGQSYQYLPGYNPFLQQPIFPGYLGYPFNQYQYQQGSVGVQLPLQIPVPGIPVEEFVKDVDLVQPGINGAIPISPLEAALLELEQQEYGHSEKYYYGRSNNNRAPLIRSSSPKVEDPKLGSNAGTASTEPLKGKQTAEVTPERLAEGRIGIPLDPFLSIRKPAPQQHSPLEANYGFGTAPFQVKKRKHFEIYLHQ